MIFTPGAFLKRAAMKKSVARGRPPPYTFRSVSPGQTCDLQQ
nr:MAG TPA: hypothetical protein [Caudoviricetes sp.]